MSRHCLSRTARQLASGSNCHLPALGKASVALKTSTTFCNTPASYRWKHSPSLNITRNYATQTLKFKNSNISVEDYQKLADQTFDALTDCLEELTQEYDGDDAEDYEVDYSNGVINLRLSDHGTYVINKQPANKQIWFSSPTSGPKRFDFDEKQQAWFMLKEGEESNLRDLLDEELSKIFGKEIRVNLGER